MRIVRALTSVTEDMSVDYARRSCEGKRCCDVTQVTQPQRLSILMQSVGGDTLVFVQVIDFSLSHNDAIIGLFSPSISC